MSWDDFDQFFDSERKSLVQFCWGLTVDVHAAQDVAQEAMLRAYNDWDRLSAEGSSPAAWVRTVALNLVRDRWRRKQSAADASHRLDRSASVCDEVGDVDLQRALEGLPERQREALVLHHLMDLPVAEAAEVMGVGPSTVKIHLRRGRKAVAEALEVRS